MGKNKEWTGNFHVAQIKKLLGKEQSHPRLKFGHVKGETQSTILAAQDQNISTNYLSKDSERINTLDHRQSLII